MENLTYWDIEEQTGYKPKTTYWQDFSIADAFVLNETEPNAVRDTHNRAWPALKNGFLGVEGLTEYVMVLNWKMWEHHEKSNTNLSRLYVDLWAECDSWAMENLKDDDLLYFLRTTD